MFHDIATAAVEVTTAAVLAARCADTLSHAYQVDILRWKGRVAFGIGACLFMTDQAVNVLLVGKVEVGILPAIASMATSTAGPVALNADAEIVYGVFLANGDGFISPFQ